MWDVHGDIVHRGNIWAVVVVIVW